MKYGARHHAALQQKEDAYMKLKEAKMAEEVKKEAAAGTVTLHIN